MTEYLIEELDSNADRRVRKTKKALRTALFKLIKEKNINQITVKEITEYADINRSTFYLYYTDVYNMFECIQDEIYQLFSEKILPTHTDFKNPEDIIPYLKRFLLFCYENPETCKFIFRNETNNQIAKRIKDSIIDIIPDSHKAFDIDDPRHFLTTYAIYGITFTIMEWVETGMKTDVDDIAMFLSYTYIFGSLKQKDEFFYKNYSKFKKQ